MPALTHYYDVENNVEIVCLHSHTTHMCELISVSDFKKFKFILCIPFFLLFKLFMLILQYRVSSTVVNATALHNTPNAQGFDSSEPNACYDYLSSGLLNDARPSGLLNEAGPRLYRLFKGRG
jgi:hypothetical protein